MINLTKLDRTNRQLGTSEPGQGDEARAAGAVAGGATTRVAVLQGAVRRARPSAVARMRGVVLRFQGMAAELMECPICLEPVGESEIAE